jgi:benzodiazapine receptor
MGYASFLVLRDGIGEERKLALTLYGTQLTLNLAWSTIFFGQHKIGLGAATLATLTANVAACIWAFYPINKNAAYLMIPYLGWLAFATALNFDIWKRNCSKNDDNNKSR